MTNRYRSTAWVMAALTLVMAMLVITPLRAQRDLTTLLSYFLNDLYAGTLGVNQPLTSIKIGTGTVQTVLTTSTASPCTIANSTETDLWTYTLPAGTLNANGRGIRVRAFGTLGATGNTKTVRLYFGGSVLVAPGTANSGGRWVASAIILRTGASAQVTDSEAIVAAWAAASATVSTTAIDTTSAIIIKVSGQNDVAAAANDVCIKGAVVETIL